LFGPRLAVGVGAETSRESVAGAHRSGPAAGSELYRSGRRFKENTVRAILYVVLFGCLSLGRACAEELPRAAPKDVGLSADKLDKVKAAVQAAVDKNRTAGVVVLVARRGKVAYLESFGKRDVEADKVMPTDALFRIHSMTKPITTVAALILYEEGKVKLDDPVSKYLPEFKGLRVHAGKGEETVEARREMTVRDLMRHTSGLTYGMPNGSPVDKLYIANKIEDPRDSLADMVAKLGKLPLQYQPGTRFHYSVSTDVLGRVVEVISEKPLDEFLQDRVFKPLDMTDTGFVVPDGKLDRFAASYRPGEKGALKLLDAPATSRYRTPRKYLSGGGGLVSTARDYARFCQMLLNGGHLHGTRLLRAETVREMTSNQLPAEALPMTLGGFPQPGLGFGLGVSVRLEAKAPKPDPGAGEYGWSGAASTYFWVAPKSELVVIVLQQVEPFDFGLQLALKPAIYAALEE
jgi:CubicO group peptidase (beta-lactamase class C family)